MANGKVWFVTGCSTGFGKVLCERLLENSEDRVVATARQVESIQPFAAEYPDRCVALALDVTRPAQVQAAVDGALAHFGGIDVLVNNAGYGVIGAVEEVSESELRAMYEVNVFGLLSVTRAVLPEMRARRSGLIINISSMAGLLALPGSATYASTKHAVEALSEGLHHELAPLGIRVLLVEPGPFRTDFAGRSIVMAGRRIPDYDETAGKRRDTIREFDGNQAGDPDLGVRAILDIVQMEKPPLRFALGAMAYEHIRNKLDWVRRELEVGEPMGLPTDFPSDD